MTTIYLIRHAEAEGNIFRRLHGQYNSNVTPNGMRQIAALSKRFADIPIDAVYASDLIRTQTTASAICRPKRLPLHTDPRFREMNCGVWEDFPFGQFDRLDHESSYNFSHHPRIWRAEGSEPFEVYTGRFLAALNEVVRENKGKTVAIFSHGMVLRGVLQTLFFPNEEGAVGHSENTAVSRLLWEDGRFTADFLQDASHLPYEISTVGKQRWWRNDATRDFNMWYRPAEPTDAPLLEALGFVPASGQRVEIAMLGKLPAGVLATELCGRVGKLAFFGLIEAQRGIGLSPQLLGEAICPLRSAGAERLELSDAAIPPAALRLLKNYGFVGSPLTLDLIPHVRTI